MADRTYEEVLGSWLVNHAENVEDMGRRVAGVLGRNPRDHHYASNKLRYALENAAKALALTDWKLGDIIEVVRDAHESALRNRADLRREFEESE